MLKIKDFKYNFLFFFGYLQVEVLQKMDDSYFGEGLTLLDERFVREILLISVLLSFMFSKLRI